MHLFKRAVIYTYTTLPPLTDEALEALAFKPCGAQESASAGFVRPEGFDRYIGSTPDNKLALVCVQLEEKLLPPAVIKRELAKKVDALIESEGRTPGRKERMDMKDEITFELLPRAFAQQNKIYALFDLANHRLIVNASPKKADMVTALLREALGSLPVVPISTQQMPALVMTDWLRNHFPQGMTPGDYCKLEEPSSGGAIHICRNDDPARDQMQAHLDAGLIVVELAVHHDPISFVLTDTLQFKGIRFADFAIESASDGVEDRQQQAQADMVLVAHSIDAALNTLVEACGGSSQPDLPISSSKEEAPA